MIIETLQQLNIPYKLIHHDAYYTMEEALNIECLIEGQMCKNLFLRNKQNYYILVLKGDKRAKLKEVSRQCGLSHLYFGTDKELEALHLYSGCVNPLSIAFDTENKVTVLLDQDCKDELLLFHPNDNTVTISIQYCDLIRYLDYFHHSYQLLSL